MISLEEIKPALFSKEWSWKLQKCNLSVEYGASFG